MFLSRPPTVFPSLLFALAALLPAASAAADAPPPKPPRRAEPAVEAGGAAGKPEAARAGAPSLKELRAIDLSAALAEARRAAAAPGAAAADKQLLAALLVLSGKGDEARAALAGVGVGDGAIRAGTDPAAAPTSPPEALDVSEAEARRRLAAAADALAAEVSRQPARKEGEERPAAEVAARLRLGFVALAAGRAKAAHEAVAALGPCKGPDEKLRLGLLGLSAGAIGQREEAARALDRLGRLTTGENHLGVRSLALVDDVRSYGVYTERAAKTCRAGENLMAYCEVLNFECRRAEGGGHPEASGDAAAPEAGFLSALDVDLTFLEQTGQAAADRDRPAPTKVVLHSRGYAEVRHRTKSPIKDLHLVIRLRVPPQCVPAEGKSYWLKVTLRDMATGEEAVSTTIPLNVE